MEVAPSPSESYQKLFLRGYPIKLLVPIIMEYLNKECNYESQKRVLENTIGLPLVRQYPLKIEYMRLLVKSIILELENNNVEVCDELYEAFSELTNACNRSSTQYRHYMLHDTLEHCITVQESTNIIGEGTTGLHTWQASQALVNWCTSNKSLLKNKCILELGSGVGLAGLAVSSECEPQSFWFSDFHPSVLGMLLSNVSVNIDRNNESESSTTEDKHKFYKLNSFGMPKCVEENILFQGRMRNTDVYVMNALWEEIADLNIRQAVNPDIVLAADVVYDSSTLASLCGALCHLVSETCFAIVACTVRNEETIDEFLKILRESLINVNIEEPTGTLEFLNLEDVPLRIFKLSKVQSA